MDSPYTDSDNAAAHDDNAVDAHDLPKTKPAGITPRGNAVWVDTDYAILVDGLRAGDDEIQIARRLGRTTSGVRRRLAWLLPPDVELPKAQIEGWVRHALLADEHYDWRSALRYHHERANRPYFDNRADQLLRGGWATGRAMPEVAAELSCDEFTAARQAIALGLASTLAEVVDRMGTSPDSVLDRRVRLSAERLGTAVWILIVDGLAQGRHVSVHDTASDAQVVLDRLLDRHVHPEDTVSQVHWTIAERVLAGGDTGVTQHDSLLPLPARD